MGKKCAFASAKTVIIVGCFGLCLSVSAAFADGLNDDSDRNLWRSMRFGTPLMALSDAKASVLHASETETLDFHFDEGKAALDLIATHGQFFFGISLKYDALSAAEGRSAKEFSAGAAGLSAGSALSLDDDVHTLGSAVLRFGVRLTPSTALFSSIGGAIQDATHSGNYAWSGIQTVEEIVEQGNVIDPVTCEPRAITTTRTISALVSTSGSYSERRFDTGLYLGAGLWTALSPFAILKFDYTFLDFGETKAELTLNRRTSNPSVANVGSATQTIRWRDIRHSFKMRIKLVF